MTVVTVCQTLYCAGRSLCRTTLRDRLLACDDVIISQRYYRNSIGYPSDSVSSLKWHVWFARCCLDRCLSTWQMIVAPRPTALDALCGQLTFQLAWCCEHSAVTVTELLQLLGLACGTLIRSSCAILTSPMDCSDDSGRDTFFRKHEHSAL